MSKESFDVFCQECNILISAKVIGQGHAGFTARNGTQAIDCDAEYYGDVYYVCLCSRCGNPFLIRQSLYGVPAEFETITDEKVIYPIESSLDMPGVPDVAQNAYTQANRAFLSGLYEPCILMCRKCLEAICKIYNAYGNNLYSKLQYLEMQGHIDSRLLSWAHEIRVIGNEAAHDLETIMSKEDARDTLDFTEGLLIYIFSLTTRFENFKERRKKLL